MQLATMGEVSSAQTDVNHPSCISGHQRIHLALHAVRITDPVEEARWNLYERHGSIPFDIGPVQANVLRHFMSVVRAHAHSNLMGWVEADHIDRNTDCAFF